MSIQDILASVSVITLSAAEVASPSSLRISAVLIATSAILLLLSAQRSYFILSILLSLCVGGYAAVRKFRPAAANDDNFSDGVAGVCSSLSRVIVRLLPPALASMFHLLALWILPFSILYGVVDARSDPEYFGQEIGHLAPASFYVVGLVILPLLILPKGYDLPTVQHQLYESIFNVGFSTIYFIIFRLSHHLRGQDPPRMSAPNWDHEFLGCIFCGAGLVGIFLALQNVKSSIHITFPTAFVAYSMISHANSHHMDMDNVENWKLVWMKLHLIHGMLFGLGALCRLVDRVPESIFLFYLGSFAFVTSAIWVVQALHSAVDYPEDPESQHAGRYPTDHVIPLLVITVGTALYALFLGTAIRLRQFLDMDADVAQGSGSFEALPLTGSLHELEDGEDEKKEERK